jgi:hypothetical protein
MVYVCYEFVFQSTGLRVGQMGSIRFRVDNGVSLL